MKIIIAPNTFKGSLDAIKASESIRKGLHKVLPDAELILHPLADGGDHTIDVVTSNIKSEMISIPSIDPIGRKMKGKYAILPVPDHSALIEMAVCSGIHLLKEDELDAAGANSYGTGILIKDAMSKGIRKIYLGVGGTATMDGGTGILKALGFKFLDKQDNEIPGGGENLINCNRIIFPSNIDELKQTKIFILSDVLNKLTGPDGAAETYAPQKGADEEMVKKLDEALGHFAEIIHEQTGTDVRELTSGGAAGGTPASLYALLNAKITEGTRAVLALTEFDKFLSNSNLIITGEGKLDEQTFHGKAPFIIAQIAKEKNIPVFFISGMASIPVPEQAENYFNAVFAKCKKSSEIEESMRSADIWLTEFSEKIGKLLSLGIYL